MYERLLSGRLKFCCDNRMSYETEDETSGALRSVGGWGTQRYYDRTDERDEQRGGTWSRIPGSEAGERCELADVPARRPEHRHG
jgi:hypothetical protein